MINSGREKTDRPFLLAQLFGLLTSGVGIIVLLGWILDVPVLTSFSLGLIPMAPSTILLFISFGVAVLIRARFTENRWLYRASVIISTIGTLIALLLFFLSSFGIYSAIEHLGLKIEGSITGVPVGHISPLTAFCFVLAGLSFLISLAASEKKKLMFTAFASAFIVILVSIILLLAHLFGAPILYGTQFIPPALSTSLAFLFLGISIISLITPKVLKYKSETDAALTGSTVILVLVFVILASGIISAGYFYYHQYQKEFRLEKERELSSVADLKISELVHIRKEMYKDASLFYKNNVFSTLVSRYFNNPKDIETDKQLRTWLNHLKVVNDYDRFSLLDGKGVEKIIIPDSLGPHSSIFSSNVSEAIKSGKIIIADFYRNENNQHVYLNIFVPISDPLNNDHVIGVLSIRIDPEEYLYPYIKSWPTSSRTSETMLVRKDGDYVLYLNEVKLKKNSGLSLRISLQNKDVPAVKAVLGEKGIVEGVDYKNVPVLAYVNSIPDSPWFIVAKIDMDEAYQQLRIRFWLMIFLIAALLFGSGASVAIVWRSQHARFYQEKIFAAETLRDSYELLEKVFNNTHIMMAYLDTEFNFLRVNNAYAEADENSTAFYPGKNHFALFPHAENEILFKKVVETGQSHIAFAKPFEYAEHPERGISYWDWSLQPVKSSDGSVTALILSTINVTDRIRSIERIEKLNRVYSLLSSINKAIVRIHDIDELFKEICRVAVDYGKFRMVWIGMINTQTNLVDVVASAGFTEDYLSKIKIDLNDTNQFEGPTLKTLRSGHYTITDDVATDERMIPWREKALKLGYRSSASLPLIVLGTVRGVIKFYSEEVEFFTEDEIKLLNEMAMDVSFALEFIEHEKKRKEAEEFLLKFRMGIERSGDAVFLTEPDGTITYVNPAFENIYGYSKEEAVGKTPRILKSGTFNNEYYKNFWNDLLSKRPVIHEIVNKTKDGRLLIFDASVNPIVNEHGETIGYLAIEREITERKHAEETLRESEDRFRDLVENSSDLICTHDSEGNLLSVNNAAIQITGYSEEELLKMNMEDLLVPEYKKLFKTYLTKIKTTGKAKGLMTIQTKTGERRIWEYNNTLRTQGLAKSIVRGMVMDITERKHAEEEIKMLAFAMRSVNECVSITDMQDRLIFMNESFKKTYGYSEEELIGKNMLIIRSPNNPAELVNEIYPATLRGGWKGEILNRKKDGSEFPISLSTTVIHDNANKPLALIGVAVDITQNKLAEKELIEAKEKAEQSDKLKSEFLAQMSHEVRTPINVITSNVSYLNEVLEGKIDVENQDCFDSINFASRRIIRTVDLILNMSELHTGVYKPIFKKLDIDSQIIGTLYSEYHRIAVRKGIELIYTCHRKGLEIFADEYSITQIFANLIDNAIKYTKKGKVELVVSESFENKVVVEIKDTGIGISKDFLPHIFEPFVQEEQGYSRSYEGNGLGLALVKRYCEINNAVIEIESEKNIGSTFRVILNKG